MSSTWDRTRCICWWWTHTPARARCPRTRTRRNCALPNSSTRPGPSVPKGSRSSSRSSTRRSRPPRTRASRTCSRSPPPRCARPATPTTSSRACKDETGVELQVLTGAEEARLTFLAARRWFGWSAGKLLVLDIGGGSLEIAYGIDEEPDAAASLPLGAGRLTAGWLPDDPPDPRRHPRPAPPCPGPDRPHGRRVQPLRRPRPRRRHLQDLQATRPHRRRRPLHRGPLRPARAQARVPGVLGPASSPA